VSANQAIAKKSGARRERGPAWHHVAARAAMLDAARRLVERDGVERLSLNLIAQEAGFAPATVYAYFVRKTDVISAIVADDLVAFARAIKDGFPLSAVETADVPEPPASVEPAVSSSEIPQDAPFSVVVENAAYTDDNAPGVRAGSDDGDADVELQPPVSVEVVETLPDPEEAKATAGLETLSGTAATDDEPIFQQDVPPDAPQAVSEIAIGDPEPTPTAPIVAPDIAAALEARIAQLESHRVDAWLERRLREFERMLAALEERVTASEHANAGASAPIESGLQELRQRVERGEQRQGEAASEEAKAFADKLDAAESRLRQTMSELRSRTLELSSRLELVERDKAAQASVAEMPQDPPLSQRPHDDRAHAEVMSSTVDEAPKATDSPDESYLVAARRAALAAQSLTQHESGNRLTGARGLSRTHLLAGLCVCLGVVVVGASVMLWHTLLPVDGSRPDSATNGGLSAGLSALPPKAWRVEAPASPDAKAMLGVGLAYLNGIGVVEDDARAAEWIGKAAAHGEAVAQYWMGTLLEHGRGLAADPAGANRWYEAAALQGNLKAMYKLAVSFAEGVGAQRNYSEAARWFSRAAEFGFVDAQYNLGVLYERGLGVPQSLLDAYKWYALAAAQGDRDSALRVEALSSQMSAEDLASARQSVAAFKPEARDAAANALPVLPHATHQISAAVTAQSPTNR
jgi:TPR repeat protein